METLLLQAEDPATVEKAAQLLRQGELVALPTETVYGLGANGLDETAVSKIFLAKGRPQDNPLILHVTDMAQAEQFCHSIPPAAYALAQAFWPGPLTMVLPAREVVPRRTTAGLSTVAVRCPDSAVTRKIIERAGVPIAAPSANISGRPSATSSEFVVEDFFGRVDMIVDGGDCEIGLESTIVMIKNDSLVLLRPGAITLDALSCVCKKVEISPTIEGVLGEDEHPLSPGMKYKHYAPASPLVLLDGNDEDVLEFLISEQKTKRCAIICYDEELDALEDKLLLPIGAKDDIVSHGKMIFARLRQCDKLSPDIIYAHLPDKYGLGLALHNRLIRAAAHTVLKIDKDYFTKGV